MAEKKKTLKKQWVYPTIDEAKATANKMNSERTKQNPRFNYTVFRAEFGGKEVFVVSTLSRIARGFAAEYFGIKCHPAERRQAQPLTPQEVMNVMTDAQIAELRELLSVKLPKNTAAPVAKTGIVPKVVGAK